MREFSRLSCHLAPLGSVMSELALFFFLSFSVNPVILISFLYNFAYFYIGKLRVYADTRGGSSWRGPQMRVGLSTTAVFGDLSSYFFGNFRDKASNTISQLNSTQVY